MAHNIMVTATPLRGVCGRVDYISNPERQEHLVATYSTVNPEFWKELSDHCQEQAKYSKSKRACEGREFMVQLANELAAMDPEILARTISGTIKKLTGTENIVAIHWNKSMTNYHAHVVTAENQELNQVKQGTVMTRDTYFDADGKRSTKGKCCADGELLPGCSMIKKGERKVEIIKYGPKIEKISSKSFLQEVKQEMSNLQNTLIQEERFKVFDRSGIHLAEQHVGKNTTEEQKTAIRQKNALVRAYNASVDEMLAVAAEISEEQKNGAMGYLVSCRGLIKKYGNTSDWVKVVYLQWKKIREKIEMLRKQLKSRDGMSIMDKLQSAQKEVQESKKTKQNRKKPELNR